MENERIVRILLLEIAPVNESFSRRLFKEHDVTIDKTLSSLRANHDYSCLFFPSLQFLYKLSNLIMYN